MNAERLDERTTVGVFFRQAARYRDKTVVRYHDGERWVAVSWARMADLALRVAGHLVEEGVAAGDRVALMSHNRLEWLYCDLAIQAAGAVTVPIYATTAPRTAQLIAQDAGIRLALAEDEFAGGLEVPRVVRIDTELPSWVRFEARPDLLAEVESRSAAVRPDDLVTLAYTSGTTGAPKGVMLAHRSFVDMARGALQVFDLGPDDEALSFMPYSHVLERINGIFTGLMAGASTSLGRGIPRLRDDLQEIRPTVMVAVPRVYEKMHQVVMSQVRQENPRRQAIFRWAVAQGRKRTLGRPAPLYPLARLLVLNRVYRMLTGGRLRFFVSGGAPLSAEIETFFWALGVKIFNGWGLTETSSGATSNTEARHRFETVGTPLPGVEVRLDDDGEILVRSPGNMLGYYGNPEATAETLEGEWVRTGDIGKLDDGGFLHIVDRKKELIKTSGGKYVAPAPLETRLMEDPVIERAVVIGDERPYVVALICPDWEALASVHGITGPPEALAKDERVRSLVQARVDELNGGLGSWETIKYFELLPQDFTEERGELTPSLKVKRRVVNERYGLVIETMYEGKARPVRAGG
jgi:long-chain acyl-CoA synthetase